jgi:fructan beta-fructosidase
MIFSGSCVVDQNNSSGFAKAGEVPMVAIYTGHIIADPGKPDDYRQAQYIAYSLDNGRVWAKYNGNPVLDRHKKDFRDPKVFWYPPTKQWIMTLVLPQQHIVQLYHSPDLKNWKHLSDFGPAGDSTQIWECPDLLEVPLMDNPGKKKWVLMNSEQYAVQYFVGTFDGTSFINENPANKIFRHDHGPDYYAAVTYNNLPANSSPVSIGWVNNWSYANDIPTTPWKSAMSLPRQLALKKINNEWILMQQPADGIKSLRREISLRIKNETIDNTKKLDVKTQQCEVEVVFQSLAQTISGVRLAAGNGHEIEIGYNAKTQTLYIDRSKTSNQAFNKDFERLSRYETTLVLSNHLLRLNIFFDNSLVEVFANDGESVLTAQLFPNEKDNGIELFSKGGPTKLVSLSLWKMKSIW